jgi:hypothetical protein
MYSAWRTRVLIRYVYKRSRAMSGRPLKSKLPEEKGGRVHRPRGRVYSHHTKPCDRWTCLFFGQMRVHLPLLVQTGWPTEWYGWHCSRAVSQGQRRFGRSTYPSARATLLGLAKDGVLAVRALLGVLLKTQKPLVSKECGTGRATHRLNTLLLVLVVVKADLFAVRLARLGVGRIALVRLFVAAGAVSLVSCCSARGSLELAKSGACDTR